MKEELTSFETSVLAKEKGFSNIIIGESFKAYSKIKNIITHCYDEGNKDYVQDQIKSDTPNHYQAPTQSLLQKWLREIHNVDITIFKTQHSYYRVYATKNGVVIWNPMQEQNNKLKYKTFEQALEEGLKEVLKSL